MMPSRRVRVLRGAVIRLLSWGIRSQPTAGIGTIELPPSDPQRAAVCSCTIQFTIPGRCSRLSMVMLTLPP